VSSSPPTTRRNVRRGVDDEKRSCDVESERHDDLQRYWDEYKLDDVHTVHSRRRSEDDDLEGLGRISKDMKKSLSTHHPAFGIDELFDTFGPLMFPIHRASLLRKRILFSATAPILRTCTFGKYPRHISILRFGLLMMKS